MQYKMHPFPFCFDRGRPLSSFAKNRMAMRTLFGLLLLFAAVACNKNDDVPAEKPTIKKIEWQVHASDAYTDPWLDAMTAKVAIRIYKSDTVNQKTAIIWDTTFATRTIRQYPV